MTVLIKAFGPKPISAKAEAMIGRLMKSKAVDEGHVSRLPKNGKP